MSGYRFKAHTPDGKVFKGVMQATSIDDVRRSLARQKLIPDSIKPEPVNRSLQLRRTPTPRSLVQFARQFATLIESAVPLLLSLEIAQGLTDDRPLRAALATVADDVASGLTLADSLRKHPRVFSDIFVSVVEAGEEGGSLDVSLNRLADYMERSQEVRDRVHSAMMYPIVILLVAVGSIGALLTLVVPTFEGMFAASGLELPFATQVLVESSRFVGGNLALLVVGTLLAILFLKAFYDTRSGRRLSDRVVLRVPLLGRLARKVAVARLSRTMASLLTSGVSLLEALIAASRTSGNMVLEEAVLATQDRVSMGSSISDALAEQEVLPSLISRMVSVGEQTGRLDDMFGKVADFYEREVDTEIDGLLKALEPALVTVVGVVLGGVVIAMYLPIFDAIGAADPTMGP